MENTLVSIFLGSECLTRNGPIPSDHLEYFLADFDARLSKVFLVGSPLVKKQRAVVNAMGFFNQKWEPLSFVSAISGTEDDFISDLRSKIIVALSSLCEIKRDPCAATVSCQLKRARNSNVEQWIGTVLKKALYADPTLCDAGATLSEKISLITDYLNALGPHKNLRRMSYAWVARQAMAHETPPKGGDGALERTRLLNICLEAEEHDGHIEVIDRMDKDCVIVRLRTAEAKQREGTILEHCVKDEGYQNHGGIFSLRDQNNQPLATLEVVNFGLSQIKGHQNGLVRTSSMDKVIRSVERLTDMGIVEAICKQDDLVNMGCKPLKNRFTQKFLQRRSTCGVSFTADDKIYGLIPCKIDSGEGLEVDELAREIFAYGRSWERSLSWMMDVIDDENLLEKIILWALEYQPDMEFGRDEALCMAAKGYMNIAKMLIDRGANVNAQSGFPLIMAACRNQINMARWLLNHGADIHVKKDQPLFDAIQTANEELIKLFLDCGANLHARDGRLLIDAVLWCPSIVDFLLEQGADPNAQNSEALMDAISYGSSAVFDALIDRGVNIHAREGEALALAISKKRIKMCEALLEAGADLYLGCASVWYAAVLKAFCDNENEYLDMLLKKAASKEAADRVTFLRSAWYGRLDKVRVFIEQGMDCHVWDDAALRLAVSRGQIPTIKFLLLEGCGRLGGDKALSDAVGSQKPQIVKLLLDHGVRCGASLEEPFEKAIKNRDVETLTLLRHYGVRVPPGANFLLTTAVETDASEIVALLLDLGADVHAKYDYALYWAVTKDTATNIVRILLDYGADVHARDDLLQKAGRSHNVNIVRLCIDRGADPNANNSAALIESCAEGDLDIAQLLLDYGADIHADDNDALHKAVMEEHAEIVRLLVDRGAAVHSRDDAALREAERSGNQEIIGILTC